jgi:hypothetical protein
LSGLSVDYLNAWTTVKSFGAGEKCPPYIDDASGVWDMKRARFMSSIGDIQGCRNIPIGLHVTREHLSSPTAQPHLTFGDFN